jgi:rubrerythrin
VQRQPADDLLELRQQLLSLWEETTWKAAVYQARARVAQREGYPALCEVLARAATDEGRYASIVAEILFSDYIKDTTYNVGQTIAREADPGRQPELIALAEQAGLRPVAQLFEQLLADRQAVARRLSELWDGDHAG